ncbi:YigZ family protein [Pseudoxanthomonas sp. F11]|uniref:IMPACT family protein n=1 Tax=Pseudoxanthomonas sp. F11 TaxID=3126308 RepID=UPI00300C2A1E
MTDTLAERTSHLLEVKHSRFLAKAAPVATPDDTLAFLREIAVPDATHNCWAYRIGGEYRSSDDGEPAGTAGRPILAAIDGQGFDRVMVVVTRWYGGIKLGAGGLVRAYGGAAAECLRTAPRQPLVVTTRLVLACVFDDLGAVHAALAPYLATKLQESFDENGALLTLELPAHRVDALKTHLRDATRNRVHVVPATA